MRCEDNSLPIPINVNSLVSRYVAIRTAPGKYLLAIQEDVHEFSSLVSGGQGSCGAPMKRRLLMCVLIVKILIHSAYASTYITIRNANSVLPGENQ